MSWLCGLAGHSRSTGSTEASFRMHEPADHADTTPGPLSAQHSRLDAQHLSRPAAGSMQQSSSDDGSSKHQHAAQGRSLNAHQRDSESRPGALSASTRLMTGSIRSSGTLRDSLEDQLRSLQVQYWMTHWACGSCALTYVCKQERLKVVI